MKDWWQDQHGARITAGPSNWQWFMAHYKNTARGFTGNYTKVVRSNLVWDTDFGMRRQTEVFYPLSEAEWARRTRRWRSYAVPQFHPELNPAVAYSGATGPASSCKLSVSAKRKGVIVRARATAAG
ncbi:MAG: hypothetical protein ABI051_10745 [Vicinamibacterales bacterium]